MPHRRVEIAIALTLFAAYAWFWQGGGWNQNSRFDQVRALAETGSYAIDDYLVYGADHGADGAVALRRFPGADPDRLRPGTAANTGDLALSGGHRYPNKPPGATFLALPAYFLIERAESILGIDRDALWPLTVNAWLATLLSVGVTGALGGVLFYRASRRLAPDVAPVRHAAAGLAFGLATLHFPFSTMLFDHVPVAVFSLLAFDLLLAERDASPAPAPGGGPGSRRDDRRLLAAGLALGFAVLCNYDAVITVACLLAYAAAVCRPRARVVWVCAGGVVPALVLAGYHAACFGTPLTLATSHEAEIFRAASGRWLGVFGAPDPVVALRLLVSPYRGLFFGSPVLLLGAWGLWLLWKRGRRAEAALATGIVLAFLTMNAAFNGWHGGYSYGPRYLIPALPFLALPLAPAFDRLPRAGSGLAVISAAMVLLATAVDPQVPFDEPRPWSGYLLPLAAGDTVKVRGAAIEGPVSANPQSLVEKFPHDLFPAGSSESFWSSFNLGEAVWPASWMSLLPLVILLAAGSAAALREAGRLGAPAGVAAARGRPSGPRRGRV
jgi:hypothetical protein